MTRKLRKAAIPPKAPGGKRHKPTEETRRFAQFMAATGFNHREIGGVIGIGSQALRKFYKSELKFGKIRTNLAVIQSAFLQAVGGPDHRWDKAKPQMTQFWLERNCGWLPPAVRMKMSGSIGHYDLSKLTDGQLDALEKLLEPIAIETGQLIEAQANEEAAPDDDAAEP